MSELTPEAKEEIREFLRSERRQFLIAGSASTVAVVSIIGGFLA